MLQFPGVGFLSPFPFGLLKVDFRARGRSLRDVDLPGALLWRSCGIVFCILPSCDKADYFYFEVSGVGLPVMAFRRCTFRDVILDIFTFPADLLRCAFVVSLE